MFLLWIVLLIINVIFHYNSYSQIVKNTELTSDIFELDQDIRFNQWKKLREIDWKIENIKTQIRGLTLLSNIPDPESKEYEKQKFPLGLKGDPIRAEINLLKAQDHLYLGNPNTAINIIEEEIKKINPRSHKNTVWANKILFEANRQLKIHEKTTDICLKMLIISNNDKELFTEKWRLSCSLEFFYETQKRKMSNQINNFKNNINIWSQSPLIKRDSKYYALSSALISLSLIEAYSDPMFSINYLENSINITKYNNEFLGKSYLILALMYFKINQKDKYISILRMLSNDYQKTNKNLKKVEKNDYNYFQANLCLARLYAIDENYEASKFYYQKILSINSEDIKIKFKNKKYVFNIEYAHVLYQLNKYDESALQYKYAINTLESNLIKNKDIHKNKTNISKFILANIISKQSEINYENEGYLIDLISQTEADIRFIDSIIKNNNKTDESIIENIFMLASLSEQYGIKSETISRFLDFKKAYFYFDNEIMQLKNELANSLKSIDYTFSGIIESRAISSLTYLEQIIDNFKEILFSMDSLEYQLWNSKSPGLEFAKKNRFELLKRLYSMDDDISNFKIKTEIEKETYRPNIPHVIGKTANSVYNFGAELASLNYLFFLSSYRIPEKKYDEDIYLLEKGYSEKIYNHIYNQLVDLSIRDRYLELSKSLKPASLKIFDRNSEIIKNTINGFYNLHYKNRIKPVSKNDFDFNEAVNESWSELINSYNQTIMAAKKIKNRMNQERKEILESINIITNKINNEQKLIKVVKDSIVKEYNKNINDLINQIRPRLVEFYDYVNITLSVNNKANYDLRIVRDNDIKRSSEEREKWLNSLRQSVKMDLIR